MRYFIGFLVTIALLIFAIVLIVHHGGRSTTVPPTKVPLENYTNTSSEVRLTIDNPVKAPQDHRQIKITVGNDTTTFELMQGYDGQSLKTQDYPMTKNAFGNFLRAIDQAGFTRGNDTPALKDERGYCPEGDRYIFEVISAGSDIERYWSTSCGGSAPSTFRGSTSLILDLFQAQVPDYETLTEDVEL